MWYHKSVNQGNPAMNTTTAKTRRTDFVRAVARFDANIRTTLAERASAIRFHHMDMDMDASLDASRNTSLTQRAALLTVWDATYPIVSGRLIQPWKG
jgi:hypothetical protein